MKKLLLLFIFLPLIGFGQGIFEYLWGDEDNSIYIFNKIGLELEFASMDSYGVEQKFGDNIKTLYENVIIRFESNDSLIIEFSDVENETYVQVEKYILKYNSEKNEVEAFEYYTEIPEVVEQSKFKYDYKVRYKYDSENNLIEEINYNKSGEINQENSYKYDSENNKIEHIRYNKSGEIDHEYSYKYDSENNLIEEIRYDKSRKRGEIQWKHSYKYDSENNLIERISYNKSGEIEWKNSYKYDSENNKIETIFYDESGEFYNKVRCKYDSENNLIEEIFSSKSGNPHKKNFYKYDSKNRLIIKSEYFVKFQFGEFQMILDHVDKYTYKDKKE